MFEARTTRPARCKMLLRLESSSACERQMGGPHPRSPHDIALLRMLEFSSYTFPSPEESS